MRFVIPLCVVLPVVHAQSTCPWLNEATARGFLAADALSSTSAINKSQDQGYCEFRKPDPPAMLRVEVRIMQSPKEEFANYSKKCGSDATPVKAIGNEAVACGSDRDRKIIGRVRNQAFILTMSPAKPESIKKAAEIVAGNLF